MHKFYTLVSITILAACTHSPTIDRTAQALATVPSLDCRVDATPGDGLDDLPAIQRALDTGCAQLGPGTFDIVTPPGRIGAGALGIIKLATGSMLRGAGPATVLKFSGDANHTDWSGVYITKDDASVSDLTLDTSALTNTEEQTHAVNIKGPAAHATIDRVWFRHPQRGGTGTTGATGIPMGGGDCIKIQGSDLNPVSAHITNNHFVLCDRSGITVHSGLNGAVISGNTFYSTGDQDLDVEGVQVGGDWSITGNVFLVGKTPPQGSWAVSLAGAPAARIAFTGNVLLGRGLTMYSVQNATISNNVIVRSVIGTNESVVNVIKSSHDVVFSSNVIVREETATPGTMLTFSHHNSGTPGNILVSGNRIMSWSSKGTGLNWVSGSGLSVVGNQFQFMKTDPLAGSVYAISVTGISEKAEDIVISDNTFRGPLTGAVRVSGSYLGAGRVTVTGNSASDAKRGLICEGLVVGAGPIVSSGNNWEPNLCPSATTGK